MLHTSHLAQASNKRRGANPNENKNNKEDNSIMDFKAEKYKKGEMVRFFRRSVETLGIVKGHDGGKVQVEWVLWPNPKPNFHGWYPMYKLKRVEGQD